MHIAATRNHPKTVSYLLSMGAKYGGSSITQTNEYGTTIAHLASHLGHVTILRTIKKYPEFNSVINASNKLGYTSAMVREKNTKKY